MQTKFLSVKTNSGFTIVEEQGILQKEKFLWLTAYCRVIIEELVWKNYGGGFHNVRSLTYKWLEYDIPDYRTFSV